MVEILYSVKNLEAGKIATVDIGGTLTGRTNKQSTSSEINKRLGMSEEIDRKLYTQHEDGIGDIGNHRAHAHRKAKNLRGNEAAHISNYAETVRELANDREILEGAEEFLQELQDRGYETVGFSSAPVAVTLPVFEESSLDWMYDWKRPVFNDNGNFSSFYINPEAQYGKEEAISILNDLGVETAHFGNGANDTRAVREANHGLQQRSWRKASEEAYSQALNELEKEARI